MIEAGKAYPGAHVCESRMHPILMEMATRQARYQSHRCAQGHKYWQQRYEELQRTFGSNFRFAEICAESWPEQSNDSMKELGWEMFKSWKRSSGHWSVACKKHDYFGVNMAQGKNGIWYACIVVADQRNKKM